MLLLGEGHELHRRLENVRLDGFVERGVARERRRVVDLDQERPQLVVHHHVEPEKLEAAKARVVRALPAREIGVLEMRLDGDERLDAELANLLPQ